MQRSTNQPAPGARMQRGDSSDEEDEKKDKKKGPLCDCPMLDKKTLLNHLPALATVSLVGVTAILVLSSNQSLSGVTEINALSSNQSLLSDDKTTQHIGLRQFLLSMPYTVFLFGFAAAGAAVAVKKKPHMLGCAAGILLVQLICLVVIGGVVTLVRGEVDKNIVWPITAVIIVGLVLVWAIMCAYPKFLRRMWCCCRRKKKEKVAKDKCVTCGGIVVNGISPNPALAGVKPCQSCGGVAPAEVLIDLQN